MSWSIMVGLVLALSLALVAAWQRRAELRRMASAVEERERAVRHGTAEAQLQHPVVDLSRCLGCGTCVAVCPEDGVLDLVHGQAMVVNGARCQGIAACERECPVDAIVVQIANLAERDDIPVVDDELEALGVPNVFLAGEVTAHALIRTAVEHGTAVGTEVGRRVAAAPPPAEDDEAYDLVIVGAGPAGLACALEATRLGLDFVVLEQEEGVGGTVAKYPRRKLVISQPIEMPLVGKLKKTNYSKEDLMAVWSEIAARHELPIWSGQVFRGLERSGIGDYVVRTETDEVRARHVCLALGRRGVPRKLGVPGEELPKVAYSLLDAHSYTHRKILVVGGGDSAVETAVGLAEQDGNSVTISYRREGFFRIRAANEARLRSAVEAGRVRVLLESEVVAIRPDHVELVQRCSEGDRRLKLANDDVFVMAGGVPPFELLKSSGVSFDPELRAREQVDAGEQGTGLIRALVIGLGLTLAALLFTVWHLDYYGLPAVERPTHPKHAMLRPGMGFGLWLGIVSVALIVANLAYLLRRSPKIPFQWGSLQVWMTSHVATGVLALLLVLVHGSMEPRDTPGGHAFWGLVILLLSGAVGRYFYAYVPRAANGRELELTEVKLRLERMAEKWDRGQRVFRDKVRAEVFGLIESKRWASTMLGRMFGLVGLNFGLRRLLEQLGREGREQGLSPDQVDGALELARHAYRTALMIAHYEDLRALLNSWRYVHRWVAAAMVALVVLHVVHALIYSEVVFAPAGGLG